MSDTEAPHQLVYLDFDNTYSTSFNKKTPSKLVLASENRIEIPLSEKFTVQELFPTLSLEISIIDQFVLIQEKSENLYISFACTSNALYNGNYYCIGNNYILVQITGKEIEIIYQDQQRNETVVRKSDSKLYYWISNEVCINVDNEVNNSDYDGTFEKQGKKWYFTSKSNLTLYKFLHSKNSIEKGISEPLCVESGMDLLIYAQSFKAIIEY